MAGRWIERFPYEHEKVEENLLTFNYSREGSDLIFYWERLFFERPEEIPEMVDMFHDMSITEWYESFFLKPSPFYV